MVNRCPWSLHEPVDKPYRKLEVDEVSVMALERILGRAAISLAFCLAEPDK
ncbi:hypothetical protein [Pseudogracilibacillus sp. SO30301A]|uniref:hypothetical protein n=1 Tax=Pseudogracilibacillus sp. SO30301A TaxID=3098291 RepID=UPI00300E4120